MIVNCTRESFLLLCNKDPVIPKMGCWGHPIKYPQTHQKMMGTSQCDKTAKVVLFRMSKMTITIEQNDCIF